MSRQHLLVGPILVGIRSVRVVEEVLILLDDGGPAPSQQRTQQRPGKLRGSARPPVEHNGRMQTCRFREDNREASIGEVGVLRPQGVIGVGIIDAK